MENTTCYLDHCSEHLLKLFTGRYVNIEQVIIIFFFYLFVSEIIHIVPCIGIIVWYIGVGLVFLYIGNWYYLM